MKAIITIILSILCSIHFGGIVYAQSDSTKIVIYTECADVEEFDATFVGGSTQFKNWIYNELQKVKVVGKHSELIATIIFVVNTDGSVSDIEIVKINHSEMTEQLTSIIKNSPKWKPSGISVNGAAQYHRQRFKLPITIEFN